MSVLIMNLNKRYLWGLNKCTLYALFSHLSRHVLFVLYHDIFLQTLFMCRAFLFGQSCHIVFDIKSKTTEILDGLP